MAQLAYLWTCLVDALRLFSRRSQLQNPWTGCVAVAAGARGFWATEHPI